MSPACVKSRFDPIHVKKRHVCRPQSDSTWGRTGTLQTPIGCTRWGERWRHLVNTTGRLFVVAIGARVLASIPRYDDIVRTVGWAGSARAAGRRPAADGGRSQHYCGSLDCGLPLAAFWATKSERKMLANTSCLYSLCAWLSDRRHVSWCIHVTAEPAVITEAPRSVKVLDNSVLSLVCRARGNPAPEIWWSRGGRRIQPSSSKRYTVIDVSGGSVLRVKPVRARRDDGFVECVANNRVSEPATASASIHVYTADNGVCYYHVYTIQPVVQPV